MYPSPRTAGSAAPSATRRELLTVLAVAWLLVIARSVVFLVSEQAFFDSDQAITGLMAKHLVEGRAFPLFFYGQTFLLGVQAWIAAPFFLVAGPTVAALHASVVAVNLAIVTLIIYGLGRWGALRPALALVPALFFALAPPHTAELLVEAGAASVMPFLYVVLLWVLRDRPLWFGAVFAVGFLNREFTIYALPALLVHDLWNRRRSLPDGLRSWLLALVVALAVWQVVQLLKPHADLMGPGTRGQLVGGFDDSQVGNLSDRMSLEIREWPSRAGAMAREYLPALLGAGANDDRLGVGSRRWLVWPLMAALVAALARSLMLARRRASPATSPFGWYLALVGATAVAGYIATRPEGEVVDRYLVLALLIPIGVTAVHLALETVTAVRAIAIGLVLGWASLMAMDHARVFEHHSRDGDELQALVAGLAARGITVAEAGYWRAYKITFLARETVKVASTDVARISEYQELAGREGPSLILIEDRPCRGGEAVSNWYLCRPGVPEKPADPR